MSKGKRKEESAKYGLLLLLTQFDYYYAKIELHDYNLFSLIHDDEFFALVIERLFRGGGILGGS